MNAAIDQSREAETGEDPRVERYRAWMEELAERGMAVARSLSDELVAKPEDGAPVQSPRERAEMVRVFTGLSRAIGRLAAIDARLARDAERRRLTAERDAWREEARAGRQAVKERVRGVLQTIILRDTDTSRPGARAPIERRLHARLDREDDLTDGAFVKAPFGEIIARLCYDLRIRPNWDNYKDEPWLEDAKAAYIRAAHLRPIIVELPDLLDEGQPSEFITIWPSG